MAVNWGWGWGGGGVLSELGQGRPGFQWDPLSCVQLVSTISLAGKEVKERRGGLDYFKRNPKGTQEPFKEAYLCFKRKK